jgi:hypothetical protein
MKLWLPQLQRPAQLLLLLTLLMECLLRVKQQQKTSLAQQQQLMLLPPQRAQVYRPLCLLVQSPKLRTPASQQGTQGQQQVLCCCRRSTLLCCQRLQAMLLSRVWQPQRQIQQRHQP